MFTRTTWSLALAGLLVACVGCTLRQYLRQADSAAYGTLDGTQKKAIGTSRPFDVAYRPFTAPTSRPAGPIRIGDVTITVGKGKPRKLSLRECLEIAFRNSRSFQDRKEDLYSSALALASARRSWDVPLPAGVLTGEVGHDKVNKGAETNLATGEPSVSLTQRFIHGGVLTLGYALDVATDLSGAGGTAAGSVGLMSCRTASRWIIVKMAV